MGNILFLIMLLIGVGVAFFLSKEFWCWYFKINARIEQNAKMIELLDRLVDLLNK